jgi:hypothetical protein
MKRKTKKENKNMLMDIDISDAVHSQAVPANEEYKLQCVGAEMKGAQGEQFGRYLSMNFAIQDQIGAKLVSEAYWHPGDAKEVKFGDRTVSAADNANQRKCALEDLCAAFGLDYNTITPSDFIGLTASAILKVKSDAKYGDSNKVQRWIKA